MNITSLSYKLCIFHENELCPTSFNLVNSRVIINYINSLTPLSTPINCHRQQTVGGGSVFMKSMKFVTLLHSLHWSIHTKDESKRGTAFAFIFGVNWLWRRGVTASFGVFLHETKCNGMTSFMEFMRSCHWCLMLQQTIIDWLVAANAPGGDTSPCKMTPEDSLVH